MRDILFRGKRIDNGEWIYGDLIQDRDLEQCMIEYFDYYYDEGGKQRECCHYEVDPNTVGQYTGLTDKNGKKIFEGDIVSMPCDYIVEKELKGYYGYDEEGYPKMIPGYNGKGKYQTIKRGVRNCVVKFHPTQGFYADGTEYSLAGIDVSVVGSIYDKPELIGGGNND